MTDPDEPPIEDEERSSTDDAGADSRSRRGFRKGMRAIIPRHERVVLAMDVFFFVVGLTLVASMVRAIIAQSAVMLGASGACLPVLKWVWDACKQERRKVQEFKLLHADPDLGSDAHDIVSRGTTPPDPEPPDEDTDGE